MRFQQQSTDMLLDSYIWDITNPNCPIHTITPSSAIVSMAFNHKNTDQIGFGCYNGTVGVWDYRTNNPSPSLVSEIETSHHEPVVDLIWLSSKGGNEFVSCSTDGMVYWWDVRNLSKPTDQLEVREKIDTSIIGKTN